MARKACRGCCRVASAAAAARPCLAAALQGQKGAAAPLESRWRGPPRAAAIGASPPGSAAPAPRLVALPSARWEVPARIAGLPAGPAALEAPYGAPQYAQKWRRPGALTTLMSGAQRRQRRRRQLAAPSWSISKVPACRITLEHRCATSTYPRHSFDQIGFGQGGADAAAAAPAAGRHAADPAANAKQQFLPGSQSWFLRNRSSNDVPAVGQAAGRHQHRLRMGECTGWCAQPPSRHGAAHVLLLRHSVKAGGNQRAQGLHEWSGAANSRSLQHPPGARPHSAATAPLSGVS